MSRRELEIRDWNIKEFPIKAQTWEAFGVVQSKETRETSKRKTIEREKKKKAEG